jgi:hypothetical protein
MKWVINHPPMKATNQLYGADCYSNSRQPWRSTNQNCVLYSYRHSMKLECKWTTTQWQIRFLGTDIPHLFTCAMLPSSTHFLYQRPFVWFRYPWPVAALADGCADVHVSWLTVLWRLRNSWPLLAPSAGAVLWLDMYNWAAIRSGHSTWHNNLQHKRHL